MKSPVAIFFKSLLAQISISHKIDQQTPPDFKKNHVPDLPKNSSTEFIKNCFYGSGGNPDLLRNSPTDFTKSYFYGFEGNTDLLKKSPTDFTKSYFYGFEGNADLPCC